MRRNIYVFISIATGILFFFYLYLGYRLAGSALGWVALSIPFFLIWSVPVFFWVLEFELPLLLSNPYNWVAFLSMGFVSVLLTVTFLRDILIIPFFLGHLGSYQWIFGSSGNCFLIWFTFLILGIGLYKALKKPRIRHIEFAISHLPDDLEGFRIVQISDLHIGPTIGKRFVMSVVQQTNLLKPHLVALTGDFGDGRVRDLEEGINPLSKIDSELGVFYVLGNHEYYWSAEDWVQVMKKMGAKVLLNHGENVYFGDKRIWVGGVVDPAALGLGEPKRAPNPMEAIRGGEEADFKILLSHNPGIAVEAQQAGFDLQLSGHTHGGQFFPWTLVAKRFHRFFLGRILFKKMWIYISPGTGTWGPPIRIGTTPEVTCLTLRKA